ncbi:MAG: divergent PAP2 family protein [Bacilli bacterium]
MEEIIIEYYVLSCGIIGLVLAQLLKPLFGIVKFRKFQISLIGASGCFPSSHTSFIIATTLAIGIKDGFTSSAFALGVVISLVIMYDAMNVRYYAGKNIELTKQIIRDLKKQEFKLDNPIYINNLKEILGHERLEVLGGFILGIIIPYFILKM